MIRYVCLSIKAPRIARLDPTEVLGILGVALAPEYGSDLIVEAEDPEGADEVLSVQVHGLEDPTSEIIRRRVEDILVTHYRPRVPDLIRVEVWEFAGSPEA